LALRANDTPDDGGRAKHLGIRTDKAIRLGSRAHAFDVGEHPGLNAELSCPRYNDCEDLAPEHNTGRQLHIMAELEVRSKLQGLIHGDIAPGLEHHHGDGFARESVADDEFANYVEP